MFRAQQNAFDDVVGKWTPLAMCQTSATPRYLAAADILAM